jgi:two-component system response regulator GlrR
MKRRVRDAVSRRPSDATVLLEGETGTGKEISAEAIHREQPPPRQAVPGRRLRRHPPQLLESELFGHERGSLHRRGQLPAGRVRSGRGRQRVPRRDWRAGARPSTEASARARAARGSPHRHQPARARRRAPDRRHEPRPAQRGRGAEVPLRSLLPVGGRRGEAAAAARANRRRPVAGRAHPERPGAARRGDRPGAPAPEFLAKLGAHDWPGNIRELRNFLERCVALGECPCPDLEPRADAGDPRRTPLSASAPCARRARSGPTPSSGATWRSCWRPTTTGSARRRAPPVSTASTSIACSGSMAWNARGLGARCGSAA